MIQFLCLAATTYLLLGTSSALVSLPSSQSDGLVGWQSSPDRRGTTDILLNCLFTTVTCIWSVQHFNLPAPGDGLWTQFLRRAKWSTLAILFPEVLLVRAVAERYTAGMCLDMFENIVGIRVVRSSWISMLKKLKKRGQRDEEDVHRTVRLTGERRQDLQEKSKFTLVHAHYAAMGGFRLFRIDGEKQVNDTILSRSKRPVDSKDKSIVLNAMELAHGRQKGFIPPFDLPSKDEIKDKSKSNAFTKAIALIQTCRLLVSVIARGCQGLEISQLEIITLAFVGCTLLTYGFWWNKPQDVETPTLLAVYLHDSQWAELQRDRVDSLWQMLFPSNATELTCSDRIPNDSIHMSPALIRPCAAIWAAATISFGSLHLIAWDFTFPTVSEQQIWRLAAVVAAYLPLLPLAINYITATLDLFERKDANRFLHTLYSTYQEFVMSSPRCATSPTHKTLLSRLEGLINENQRRDELARYSRVFDIDSSDMAFRADLHEYVHELHYSDPSYPCFPQELKRLLNIIDDLHNTQQPNKYDDNADLIDLFPKIQRKERQLNDRSLQGLERQKANVRRFVGYIGDDLVRLWPRKSFFVLSAGLYCLARLSILALAIASLRMMPDSVYDVSWMNHAPTF
ncbi:MAG: hypothetical protein Q9166_006003 [cf. Caloplaca sp. 2 TL-2023]